MSIGDYLFGVCYFLLFTSPLWGTLPLCYLLYRPKKSETLDKTGSGDNALVVLHYNWVRMSWAFYFPFILGAVMFGAMTFGTIGNTSDFRYYLAAFFAPILFFSCLYFIARMLLAKDIRLYNDRIVQNYRIFGQHTVYLSSALYSIGGTMICFCDEKSRFPLLIFQTLYIDLNLCRSAEVTTFIEKLSELAGKSYEEMAAFSWKRKKFTKSD